MLLVMAMIAVLCVMCTGNGEPVDEDWLAPGGTSPSNTDDIYHMGKVGIGTTSPQGLLQVGAGTFVVTEDQWVGIGTDSPTAELDVHGSTSILESTGAASFQVKAGGSGGAYLELYAANAPDAKGWMIYTSPSDWPLILWHNGAHPLVITDDLKVGIGTDAPTETLDVNGGVRVEDLPQNNTLNDIVVADAGGVLHVRSASTLGGGVGGADTDWLETGADPPTNTGEVYHMGNVDIGDTEQPGGAPEDYKLYVAGGNVYMAGKLGVGTYPDPAARLVVEGSVRADGYWLDVFGECFGNPNGPRLCIQSGTQMDLYSDINTMTLKSGNVGIGDSTPDAKLDVTGTVALATEDNSVVWIGGEPQPTINADLRVLGSSLVYSFAVGDATGEKNYFTVAPVSGQNRATVNINDVLHLTPRASDPPNPSQGDIYVNSNGNIYCYLSNQWKQLNNS